MVLPDLNLLLFAYNPHAPQHAKALEWWESVVNGDELIGLPHEILFGFLRIATNPALGEAAVPFRAARRVVEGWIGLPNSRILLPGPDHFRIVAELMETSCSVGRVLSDAVLAAFAIANRATLYSSDSDFARFEGLRWENPLS